ncbi:hypothetical protein CDIK_3274 [Cucumispora dikerogammari]|nr:hypothetical protein CDIK_3274 [Cucumispora dikerogammari]
MLFYYLKSQRRKENLIYKECIFNFRKIELGIKVWRCKQRKCKVFVSVLLDESIIKNGVHNHSNEKTYIVAAKLSEALKQKALVSKERPKDILVGITKKLPRESLKSLPALKSLGNIVTKKRREKLCGFHIETSDIPAFLKNTLIGENFYRFDEGTNEKRFIVFMSTSSERDLERSKVWLIDGTFYSTPRAFFQLITVHGFLYEKRSLSYTFFPGPRLKLFIQ